jgi:hypothetical protein
VVSVPGFTPVALLAGSGQWYRARLPDGREGYVAVGDTEALTPLETTTVIGGSLLRAAPALGAAVDSVAEGDDVPVLGRFGDYAFVRTTGGLQGWVGGSSLAVPAPVASAPVQGSAVGGR